MPSGTPPTPGRGGPRQRSEFTVRRRSYRTVGSQMASGSLDATGGPEACAIPRCADAAVETFRLQVGGAESMLLVCQIHADWLGRYMEEDVEVRLVHRGSSGVTGPIRAAR